MSFRRLLEDANAGSLDRPQGAVFFHRPGRKFSAIHQGDHKPMLFWNRDGSLARQELYDVGENPVEQGRDTANDNKPKANALQTTLLTFLKSVSAETPSDIPPKRK